MQIIEGKDIDIIEPFPFKALPHVVDWMHCYRTVIIDDNGPTSDDEVFDFLIQRLRDPNIRSFGIIDKFNLTKSTVTDVPIVGIGFFDQISPNNGYFHVISNRAAWGNKLADPGLIEQAGNLLINELFSNIPGLTRISCSVVSNNKPAINLAKRLGFEKDGYFKDMIYVNKKLLGVIHLGLTRQQIEQKVNVQGV